MMSGQFNLTGRPIDTRKDAALIDKTPADRNTGAAPKIENGDPILKHRQEFIEHRGSNVRCREATGINLSDRIVSLCHKQLRVGHRDDPSSVALCRSA